MSNNFVHFTPRDELEPHAKLEAFVEFCRRLETLNAHQQFDCNKWIIGYRKGHKSPVSAVFSTAEAAGRRDNEPSLPQPFLDFAKAVIIYLHAKGRGKFVGIRISALRFLEAALREWNKDSRPTAVNADVLDTAVELAHKSVTPAVAYRIAGQLRLIATLMQSMHFISLRQPWDHGIKKPKESGSRISKEALQARQEKLPSAAALRALAAIFHQATRSRDVVTSSFAALMTCAPERINEVLRLKRNALTEGDGRFAGNLGLRWPGSKQAYDTVKWLPTVMTPVAREAMTKLLKATEPAQKLATWYTLHPSKLYLHEDARYLADREILTPSEIAIILFNNVKSRVSAGNWAKSKFEQLSLGGNRVGYYFKDVEAAVLSMLPPNFPFVSGAPGLLCKDSLALSLTNEMHSERGSCMCMFSEVDYETIFNTLTAHDGQPSIFTRFGYWEDDGSEIEMNSHSLRHYLNMLAHMGGMSSAEIALFSGRKDENQNKYYDHMTLEEVQAPISEAMKSGFMGSIVTKQERTPIIRSHFSKLGLSAAHTTEYGVCMHDFASEPCQMHRDCINCEEHECIKGENHKEKSLRILRSETEKLIKIAKAALNDAEYGADAWVIHHTQKLERINTLLSIFDDPTVPDGARIRLNIENSPLIGSSNNLKTIKFKRKNRKEQLT